MYRYPGKPFYIPNPTYNKVKAKEVETDLLDAEEIEVDGFVVDNITTTNLTATNNNLEHITSTDIITSIITTPSIQGLVDLLMSGNLEVEGTLHARDTLSVTNRICGYGGAYIYDYLIIFSYVNIQTHLNVGTDLTVTNNTNTDSLNASVIIVSSNTQTNTLSVVDYATIGTDLNVTDILTAGSAHILGQLQVEDYATIGTDLTVTDILTAGSAHILGQLQVDASVNIENQLSVGMSVFCPQINVATINCSLNINSSGQAVFHSNIIVYEDSFFHSDLSISSDLSVGVDATIDRDLIVSRYSTFSNDMTLNGNVFLNGDVTGDLILSGDIITSGVHSISTYVVYIEDFLKIGQLDNLSSTYAYSRYDIFTRSGSYAHYFIDMLFKYSYELPSSGTTTVIKDKTELHAIRYEDYPFYTNDPYKYVSTFSYSDNTNDFASLFEGMGTYSSLIDKQQVNIYEQGTKYDADCYEIGHSALRRCYWAYSFSTVPRLLEGSTTTNPEATAYSLTSSGFKVFGTDDTAPWERSEDMRLRFFVSDSGSIQHPRRPTGTGTDLEISTSGWVVRNTSSRACKRNFQEEFDTYGDWILDLPLLTFQFKEGIVEKEEEETRYFGPMAEDIYELHPTAAVFNKEENKVEGIYSPELRHSMLAVIQKQAKQIKSMEERLEILENLLLSNSVSSITGP